MKQFKIQASDRKEAYDIQQTLFKLGYDWTSGTPRTVQHPEALTFFTYSSGVIMHANSDFGYFDEHENSEETLQSLQTLLVEKVSVEDCKHTLIPNAVAQPTEDAVNNPKHYTSHPSGVECIDVTRHMSFNLGNATKYIWRCDLKKDAIEDLRKAIFYLNDEINLRLNKEKK